MAAFTVCGEKKSRASVVRIPPENRSSRRRLDERPSFLPSSWRWRLTLLGRMPTGQSSAKSALGPRNQLHCQTARRKTERCGPNPWHGRPAPGGARKGRLAPLSGHVSPLVGRLLYGERGSPPERKRPSLSLSLRRRRLSKGQVGLESPWRRCGIGPSDEGDSPSRLSWSQGMPTTDPPPAYTRPQGSPAASRSF